jgi:hypothetical protein
MGIVTTEELYAAWLVVDPLHTTWRMMLRRCENEDAADYPRYGGRGIKVHESWHDFQVFLADVVAEIGLRPEGVYASGRPLYSLDRINNNGNYEPGNVRWADSFVQVGNRRPVRTVEVPSGHLGRVRILGEVEPVTAGVLPNGTPRLQRAILVRCEECESERLITLSNLNKLKQKVDRGWVPTKRCYCTRFGTRLSVHA